jgi:hypothetical protein
MAKNVLILHLSHWVTHWTVTILAQTFMQQPQKKSITRDVLFVTVVLLCSVLQSQVSRKKVKLPNVVQWYAVVVMTPRHVYICASGVVDVWPLHHACYELHSSPLHTQSIRRHSLNAEYDRPGAAINNPKCGDHEGQGLHNVMFFMFRDIRYND